MRVERSGKRMHGEASYSSLNKMDCRNTITGRPIRRISFRQRLYIHIKMVARPNRLNAQDQ